MRTVNTTTISSMLSEHRAITSWMTTCSLWTVETRLCPATSQPLVKRSHYHNSLNRNWIRSAS